MPLATGTRMVEPWQLEAPCAALGHDSYVAGAVRLREERLIQLALGEPSTVALLALTNTAHAVLGIDTAEDKAGSGDFALAYVLDDQPDYPSADLATSDELSGFLAVTSSHGPGSQFA